MYECNQCNKKYKTEKKYQNHLKTHSEQPLERNYTHPQKINTFIGCPVDECRRKYKNEIKLKKHIEINHFYATRKRPTHELHDQIEHEVKIKIYQLAINYLDIIADNIVLSKEEIVSLVNNEPHNRIIIAAKNLLPQKHNQIENEELSRMACAQHEFSQKIVNLLTDCNFEKLLEDVLLFFKLGLPYYDSNFCPTLLIDFMWHSTMQDYDFYSKVCRHYVGEIIPHCSKIRSKEEDLLRSKYFHDVFAEHYGRQPYQSQINPFNISDIKKNIQDEILSLNVLKEKERLHEEKLKEERRLHEEKLKEERRLLQETLKEEILDFCKRASINLDNISLIEWSYNTAYNERLSGSSLLERVKELIQTEYSYYDSKC